MLRDLHIIQREMLQHFEKMRLPGTKNNFEKRKNVFGSRSDFLPFFYTTNDVEILYYTTASTRTLSTGIYDTEQHHCKHNTFLKSVLLFYLLELHSSSSATLEKEKKIDRWVIDPL